MNALDFVFGKKALKKAAGEETPAPAATPAPQTIDVAGAAQKTAAQKLKGAAGGAIKKKLDDKKKKLQGGIAGRIGSQFMDRGDYA